MTPNPLRQQQFQPVSGIVGSRWPGRKPGVYGRPWRRGSTYESQGIPSPFGCAHAGEKRYPEIAPTTAPQRCAMWEMPAFRLRAAMFVEEEEEEEEEKEGGGGKMRAHNTKSVSVCEGTYMLLTVLR